MATSYDSKEFCQKYKLPTLIDMENLAPQSNENNKFITQIVGQDTFDFDKNLDDNGKQLITIFYLLFYDFGYKSKYTIFNTKIKK